MRVFGTILGGLAALVVAGACASSTSGDDDGTDADDGGAGTVTADYCTKYCNAQQSAGTLQGTKTACLATCCKDVSGGCPSSTVDSGTDDDDDDGITDAGTRIDGSVCAKPCGSACCGTGQGCGVDGTGKAACLNTCRVPADCPQGVCAPATNTKGDPVGPYICKPNDGKNYNGCTGAFTTCAAPACCVVDANKNQFCAVACGSNAACGAGHCVGYSFELFNTTCQGPTACGP